MKFISAIQIIMLQAVMTLDVGEVDPSEAPKVVWFAQTEMGRYFVTENPTTDILVIQTCKYWISMHLWWKPSIFHPQAQTKISCTTCPFAKKKPTIFSYPTHPQQIYFIFILFYFILFFIFKHMRDFSPTSKFPIRQGGDFTVK